mgnify:CR=1 FL=1
MKFPVRPRGRPGGAVDLNGNEGPCTSAVLGEELVDHGEDALGMLVADRLGLPGRNFAVAAQKGRAAPLVRRIKSKNE